MRDQKAVKMSGVRRPCAYPGTRARARQVNGAARPHLVAAAVRRKMFLVRAPAEFGGLSPFADEAVHRPGVDEFIRLLGYIGDLGVALRDMHDLDAELLCESRPSLAARRHAGIHSRVLGNIEQGLLDQVRHQAWIRAMGE